MFYRLHGFRVRSNAAIPGLSPCEPFADADLEIFAGESPPLQDASNERPWFQSRFTAENGEPVLVATWLSDRAYCRLAYSDGVTFVLNRAASAIWVTWPASLTIRDIPTYLLGPIIGLVLRLRGITSLHASAVAVDDQAIVFVGRAGSGKSTTAGAFAMRGAAVLADDTVALRRRGALWTVSPGYPRLRLWPDSAGALSERGGPSGFLPPGASGSTRRFHLDLTAPGRRFVGEPLPLGMVYLLGISDTGRTAARPATPSEAVIALVANTYANELLDRDLRAREFDDLSQLVQDVPIRHLARPTDLSSVDEYPDQVLDDLEQSGFRISAHGVR